MPQSSIPAPSRVSPGHPDGRLDPRRVEVDPDAQTLTRAGEEVSLTPKAFDLLLALIAHEGRVVSRHDLLREVWGHLGAVVTRTVDSHISELRQKLEDDPVAPRHIHTVWKRGYRFDR